MTLSHGISQLQKQSALANAWLPSNQVDTANH
jgi:hypothetical protein